MEEEEKEKEQKERESRVLSHITSGKERRNRRKRNKRRRRSAWNEEKEDEQLKELTVEMNEGGNAGKRTRRKPSKRGYGNGCYNSSRFSTWLKPTLLPPSTLSPAGCSRPLVSDRLSLSEVLDSALLGTTPEVTMTDGGVTPFRGPSLCPTVPPPHFLRSWKSTSI